jgi:hypothetical protein
LQDYKSRHFVANAGSGFSESIIGERAFALAADYIPARCEVGTFPLGLKLVGVCLKGDRLN